ncbi:tetratricopeptide repeat protein, partial [Herbidospora mongoliensis]|uniref:tetratricopeptide repeat protein n=1 Tax=Herbidospora mongoliensis TaxID=688067 RepID=UPI000A4DB043
TLNAIGNLAATLHAQGELSEARTMQEQALDARRRLLGPEHPDTLNTTASLAAILYTQGETAGSRLLLRDALDMSSKVHGKKNPITSKMAMELVSIFDSPHEASARKALIMQNLSWLSKEPPANLTGEQKSIKERLKGFLFGGSKSAKRRQPRGRK